MPTVIEFFHRVGLAVGARRGACPKCGLVNLPTADRCGCGFDFSTVQKKRGLNFHLPKASIVLSLLAAGMFVALWDEGAKRALDRLTKAAANSQPLAVLLFLLFVVAIAIYIAYKRTWGKYREDKGLQEALERANSGPVVSERPAATDKKPRT